MDAGRGKKKHSVKREAILSLLQSTTIHPGAQWVYGRLRTAIPDLSLGTVYRNLSLFREEGTAASLGVVGGEERFDGITEPHPHVACTRCGALVDLEPRRAEALIRSCEETAEEPAGTAADPSPGPAIDFRRTLFYGLCGNCRNVVPAAPAFRENASRREEQ
ncbi:MAG: transcriptional repressor [Treponema sp.]|jgi:Fur family peroxide stress response transcriptional regulator|nr:transcriptional repressor [Treponema sp.]